MVALVDDIAATALQSMVKKLTDILLSFWLDANWQVIGEALHTNAMQGVAMTMTKLEIKNLPGII